MKQFVYGVLLGIVLGLISVNANYVYATILPPLKQIASGVSPENVECFDGLVLIKKLSKDTVACVRPQTADRLVERGWGTLDIVTTITNKQKIWVDYFPISCFDNICNIDWLKPYYESTDYIPKHILGLTGFDFTQTTEFIKDYYKKQGITVSDVNYGRERMTGCEYGECWEGYRLYLQIMNSDLDKIINFGYNVSNATNPK